MIRASHIALGIASLVSGLAISGFLPQAVKAPRRGDPKLDVKRGYGRIFGLLPTNTPFNFLRLALGAWGLFSSQNEKQSRRFLAILGSSYAVMALMGLLPKARTSFGLLPMHGSNIWLHAGTAAAAASGLFVHRSTEIPQA